MIAKAPKVLTLMTPYNAIDNFAPGKAATDPIAFGGTVIGDCRAGDANVAIWAGNRDSAYDANRSIPLGGIVGNKGVGNGNEGVIYADPSSAAGGMVVNNLAILNSDRGKKSGNSPIAIGDGEAINDGRLGQGGLYIDHSTASIPVNRSCAAKTPRPANGLVSPLQRDSFGEDQVLGVGPCGNQDSIAIPRLAQSIADGGTGAGGVATIGRIAARRSVHIEGGWVSMG